MDHTIRILTVSELTADIKEVLENVFADVCVVGEVSNLRQPASGHIYFSLKDETSQLRSVLFKGSAFKLKFSLADGMKIACRGRVGVYDRDGQYQLYVNSIEPQGKGALALAFEQLKEKLSREGLFDESHKKELPFLPAAIGIITSPTGAVIQDILHVLDRRFGSQHVIMNPVRVQGEEAGQEIVNALQEFNQWKNVDVIIIARGGGSLEDLWCFNDELLARAIFESKIPVISAIGHETDFTIADFVADKRAPTPSAAAEMVMPSRAELDEKIGNLLRFLWKNFSDIIPQYAQRIDDLYENMSRAVENKFKTQHTRLKHLKEHLNALSPLAVLKRGYSIASLEDHEKILYSSQEVKKGDKIFVRLSSGALECEVLKTVS